MVVVVNLTTGPHPPTAVVSCNWQPPQSSVVVSVTTL